MSQKLCWDQAGPWLLMMRREYTARHTGQPPLRATSPRLRNVTKLLHTLLLLSHFSRVWLCVTPQTAAYQALLSLRFSSQERWIGLPFPSPMINLDHVLKSKDITLPTKVHLVKSTVFTVVMYGCESWSIKKAEHRRTDTFELCVG